MRKFFIIALVFITTSVVWAHTKKSTAELKSAFEQDNFVVVREIEFQGQRGLLAEHKISTNYETKEKRRAFYLEGNSYQMGYLLGSLAHEDVEKLSSHFVDRILLQFMKIDVDPKKVKEYLDVLKEMISLGVEDVLQDMPASYIEELEGIQAACLAANPQSQVTMKKLLRLNVGFDVILSNFYALNKSVFSTRLDPRDLDIPVMCNAFSVFGNATKDGKHYFGRDFMFPTGDLYQDLAAYMIYVPSDERLPMVTVTAPGMIGSITAMNVEGVGMGLDMVPGNNCTPERPGLNSLMAVRNTAHYGTSAQSALDKLIETQRGVTWLYFIADGKNNRSAAVEAGASLEKPDFLSMAPPLLRALGYLPNAKFVQENETQKAQKGLMVRWNDYKYPQEFTNFNNDLFSYHGKKQTSKSWGERGYINRVFYDTNCPDAYYFAPQRESKDDVLIMCNHYITPSIRFATMNPWTMLVTAKKQNDSQWRYDELNNQIMKSYGEIDYQKAKDLIDYLSPLKEHKNYYSDNEKSSDGKRFVVEGSVSICNLTDKTIETLSGYYGDEWTSVSLMNYIEK